MRTAGIGLDVAALALFVGIGRDVHAHGLSLGGMATTGWPFLTGLVIGWFLLAVRRWDRNSVRGGVLVVAITVALGMALRVVAGQGTAFVFVLVALSFLGATMVGWRVIQAGIGYRR